jgi:hypothetical protein
MNEVEKRNVERVKFWAWTWNNEELRAIEHAMFDDVGMIVIDNSYGSDPSGASTPTRN